MALGDPGDHLWSHFAHRWRRVARTGSVAISRGDEDLAAGDWPDRRGVWHELSEPAVAIQSAFAGNADIALGNAVGSNIFNVLFILGISALIVHLVVSSRLVRWDVPLMIMASVLLLVLGLDGRISRTDGLLLFGGLLAYLYWCVRQSRSEAASVKAEFAQEIPTSKTSTLQMLVQIGFIIAGLILLGLGSHWLIGGSVFVATRLGVSDLMIGLTIITAGTSLPEVVTSIMAASRGERDIAVGNVVGIFLEMLRFVFRWSINPDISGTVDVARAHTANLPRSSTGQTLNPHHVGYDFWQVLKCRIDYRISDW